MISERKFKKHEEVFYYAEPNFEKIYEIMEQEYMSEIFQNNDLQDEKSTQDILEVYIILFWGISALVSTLLWLYFFIDRLSSIKLFRLS